MGVDVKVFEVGWLEGGAEVEVGVVLGDGGVVTCCSGTVGCCKVGSQF